MRPELEAIEQIEKYLLNELSADERQAFEQQMNVDLKLKEAVEMQQQLVEGVDRLAIREAAQKAWKSYKLGKWYKGGAITGIVAVVAIGAVMFFGNPAVDPITDMEPFALPELNEEGTALWADADKYLPYQFFSLDTDTDTIIETEGGIVMAIPAGCFVDENGNPVKGPIQFEIKEALDAESIIEAGLSTMSGDQLLETGGMFYLNARKDGESLQMDANNPIYTVVPKTSENSDMQLFDGVRQEDGTIDWQNPKPLEKFLTPVDMAALDFYPPDYEKKVESLGYYNKEFKDSLYYSFASEFGATSHDSESTMLWEGGSTPEVESIVTWSTEYDVSYYGASFSSVLVTIKGHVEDGWVLYGMEQWEEGVSAMTLTVGASDYYSFDSNSIVESPPFSTEMDDVFGEPITYHTGDFSVSFRLDARDYWDYLCTFRVRAAVGYGVGTETFLLPPDEKEFDILVNICEMAVEEPAALSFDDFMVDSGAVGSIGLNPAKVQAVWNEDFNGTVLATKEFEERLREIHLSGCGNANSIFDLYANNLGKRMSEIDSMAMNRYGWGSGFAARGDGRVKDGDKLAEKLGAYFNNKSRELTEVITKTQEEFWSQQANLDAKYWQEQQEQNTKDWQRAQEQFRQELDINLEEAYRQVGKPLNRSAGGLTAAVTTPGWKNLDAYVLETTANRETLDYTDPETGAKAVIEYEPFTVKVTNYEQFDRTTTYLIPDQLRSFQRMNGENGIYTENLNELIQYGFICVGYKGEEKYFFDIDVVKPGEIEIELEKVSEIDFVQAMNRLDAVTQKDIEADVEFNLYVIQDEQRQQANQDLLELRSTVRPVVFPCDLWIVEDDTTEFASFEALEFPEQ